MFGFERNRFRVGSAVLGILSSLAAVALISCGTSTAVVVNGPGGSGNIPPTLTITLPVTNVNVSQGDPFLIEWTDADPDNNASISFDLIDTATNAVVPLVSGLAENDQVGPDSHTVNTSLIPEGVYNLRGTINDGVGAAVSVFATTTGATPQRVIVRILAPGQGELNQPPIVFVAQPGFDLSVTQDDVVNVVVQPTSVAPTPANPGPPYDPDSNVTLFVVFDLDLDPNNDDPANPDPSRIVVVAQQSVAANAREPITFPVAIDLNQVPPRPNGDPYFIRITADDGTNPRVHQYAVGTIHVTQLAAGLVDLSDIGRRLSGTRWYGFNPGANLGSTVATIDDFDADGVDDFIMVAQFGNPRNAGLIGEAYLVYGLNGIRFGGTIAANSVAETISGVIFEGAPVRANPVSGIGLGAVSGDPRTDGITDINILPDYTGDGRPELIFGASRVFGAYDGMDFDPADQDAAGDEDTTDIEVEFRQGRVAVSVADGNFDVTSTTYAMEDTTITTADPGASLGSSPTLSWQDDGLNVRTWTLLKFPDVLEEIPDDPFNIDIPEVTATLELSIFDVGGTANVNQALTDFDEQTTYSTYAQNGGDPEADVDFLTEPDQPLEDADGSQIGLLEIDVSPIIQRLLLGLLNDEEFDNEVRIILSPAAGNSANASGARSSEYTNPPNRPLLRINYPRLAAATALGCYPDPLVNNVSDTNNADNVDIQWYGGGMAVIVNSTNRDNDGPSSAARLESTTVNLELSGARVPFPLDTGGLDAAGGDIFPRADNSRAGDALGIDPDEAGRIAGARIIGGPFDFEDHLQLRQPAREDLFGRNVGSLGDVDNDGLGEIVISAPRNERYIQDLVATFGFQSTHFNTTAFTGSIVVVPGTNYNDPFWRDINDEGGTATVPFLDHHRVPPFGSCQNPVTPRHTWIPAGTFEVFAEDVDDMLGGADSAGDFNQDGLDDLLCGAFLNDRNGTLDTGAVYILYSRNVLSDFDLTLADDPIRRAPMLRIRGVSRGDQIGWRQTAGRDVNGDRIDDVFFSSPRTDFGGVTRATCGEDFDEDGVVDQDDFNVVTFNQCLQQFGNDLFRGDDCKVFDYDNDNDLDEDDRCIFCCLSDDCDPEADCVLGRGTSCCENVVDNGFAAVIFGGRFLDGDRSLSQIATTDLPGVVFHGGHALDRAGADISSAGDFNQDGFGDILIVAPGEVRLDSANRVRVGVVYLVFGGTHLQNTVWNLADPQRGVGSAELPGIVFLSPYVEGRPNEAAPLEVALIGDINNDGFDDIAIGNPKADFIDLSFPQGPDAPGSDAAAGRRRDAGDVYIIYGSNFGTNR